MQNFLDKSNGFTTKLNGRTRAAVTEAKAISTFSVLLLIIMINGTTLGLFTDQDFQVYTRAVLISDRSLDVGALLNTFERYSATLNRGQLHLELPGSEIDRRPTSHSSYYSSDALEPGKLLKVSTDQSRCKLVDGKEMALELFGSDQANSMAELKILLNLLPDSEANRHVIGLARLLVFFDENRDQFSRVSQPVGATFKNLAVDLFSLEIVENNSPKVEVRVLLPVSERANETKVANRNPIRMLLRFPSQVEFVVDFNRIGHIQPALTNSMFEQIDQLALDSRDSSTKLAASRKLFNLPLGRGCGHLMDPTRSKSDPVLRNPLKHPEEIYSFKFQLNVVMATGSALSSSHVQSSFVAYDGLAQLLRIELVHETGSVSKNELTIYDFNLGFKLHVGAGQDHSRGQLVVVNSPTNSQQLARRPICTKVKLSKVELLPSEPILPLEQLVHMGWGEVRGVESAIYETKTKRLPRMIFEQTMVGLDENENDRNKTAPIYYTLVYHLAAANNDNKVVDDSQQLLRMDVYDSESQHRFRVELFNFQWRLSEAPNGDQQHQLFTLSQRCELPQSTTHLIQLNLELTQEEVTTEAVDLIELKHSSTRNTQLIRGLTTLSTHLSGGQILNVISRLAVEGNELKESQVRLKLLVGLSVLPANIVSGPPLVQTRRIATGMVSDHSVQHSFNSYTLSECFWEASRWAQPKWSASSELSARPQIGAIFTFCFSRCWIESEAQLRRWPDGTKVANIKEPLPQLISNSFQVSQDPNRVFPCQLFLIEQQVAVAQESTLEPGEILLDKLSSQLANKTLNVAGLDFKVTRNYVGRDSEQELDSDEPNLKGLAFVLGRGNSKLSQKIVWSANIERPRARLLDSGACHAVCVANATCRSYSVCLNANGQLECLMSSIDVRELEILRELRSKLEENKQNQRSTSSEGAEIQLSVGLNLRVSKRCQVRSKRAQDLFRQIDANQTKASNLYVSSFRVVASREQCAELCLNHNAGYFQRLVRFQVEIEMPSSESDDKSDSNSSTSAKGLVKPNDLHERHLDTLRYWCDRYKYLTLTPNTIGFKKLRDQLLESGPAVLKRTVGKIGSVGLCYSARGRWARSDIKPNGGDVETGSKNSSKTPSKLISIKMDTFEFRYSLLYQRQEGLRLAGLKSLVDEHKEQVVDVAGDRLQADFRLHNIQSIDERPIDVESCARQCFTQSVQWCRSFDLVQVDKTFYCIYNSLGFNEFHSMARSNKKLYNVEADRLIIERPANGSRARFYHYEPLEGYALDIVKLKLDDDKDAHDQQDLRHRFGSKRLYVVIGFGLLLTLLALTIVNETNRRDKNRESRIPEVNIARLSFSLPVNSSANSSLLSQDQLELQHNAREEQISLEQINE